MKRLHVIGRKNNGKTTLIVDLIHALTVRGLTIATIKHTHHRHELDTPGKDSHRHRQAGAAAVGILSPQLNAVFWTAPEEPSSEAKYADFERLLGAFDLVLVEGDTFTAADKIEVWRDGVTGRPLADQDPSILRLVTDDPITVPCPVLRRHPLDELVRWIVERYAASPRKM